MDTPSAAQTTPIRIAFDNSYARLPEEFFKRTLPTPVDAPRLIALNRPLAVSLGLDPDALSPDEWAQALSGNAALPGSDPIATAYAGHQFGQFVPQLGDGRAILLGEVVDGSGVRRDIQLKGSGPTIFSRRGDGRAALGPVLREYLVSEAIAALGIPTTRALAAVSTGETVYRQTGLPGAVLTRVASSHIRVGTFQFFAARRNLEALKSLVDHALARHYPEAAGRDDKALALLEGVVARQARLIAQWMHVGFVHGVMNTDNSSIAGETIDYGPCAFIDAYDPVAVFSSIDEHGRYAFARQPSIAHWNLTRLAECLVPMLGESQEIAVERATQALDGFAPAFEAAYFGGLRAKLGLASERDDDPSLIQDLLDRMREGRADHTLTFRRLAAVADGGEAEPVRSLFIDPTAFDAWAERYRARLDSDEAEPSERRAAMDRVNPAIIPRNHLVEAVITAAVEDENFAPFEALHAALSDPYSRMADDSVFAAEPPAVEEPYRTFCGT